MRVVLKPHEKDAAATSLRGCEYVSTKKQTFKLSELFHLNLNDPKMYYKLAVYYDFGMNKAKRSAELFYE